MADSWYHAKFCQYLKVNQYLNNYYAMSENTNFGFIIINLSI